MEIKYLLEEMKKRLKKFKEDVEKESVSHGDHKPHCCALPEEVVHPEAGGHKGAESGTYKKAA